MLKRRQTSFILRNPSSSLPPSGRFLSTLRFTVIVFLSPSPASIDGSLAVCACSLNLPGCSKPLRSIHPCRENRGGRRAICSAKFPRDSLVRVRSCPPPPPLPKVARPTRTFSPETRIGLSYAKETPFFKEGLPCRSLMMRHSNSSVTGVLYFS